MIDSDCTGCPLLLHATYISWIATFLSCQTFMFMIQTPAGNDSMPYRATLSRVYIITYCLTLISHHWTLYVYALVMLGYVLPMKSLGNLYPIECSILTVLNQLKRGFMNVTLSADYCLIYTMFSEYCVVCTTLNCCAWCLH